MSAEYEQALDRRLQDLKAGEEAKDAESEKAQPFWRGVFEESERLLEREGTPEPQSLWGKIEPKLAFLFTSTILRPLRRDAFSRVWVLEKDVDFDGKTKSVTITARSNGKSPKNSYELGIDVGELSLRARKFGVFGTIDNLVRVDIYRGEDEVPQPGISDATFFQEVIVKTAQAPAKAILPKIPGHHLEIRYP